MRTRAQKGPEPWPRAWDTVGLPTTAESASQLVQACIERLSGMTDMLRKKVRAGDLRGAKSLGRLVLHSDSARIAAIAKSVRQKVNNEPSKIDWQSYVGQALMLDMWTDSGEPVFYKTVDRVSGKVRLNFEFGVREYARQYLALQVTKGLVDLSPRQFIIHGGMPSLVDWMNQEISKAKVVVTTDVPKCFYSLNRERLEADMPLPVRVTRSVLSDPMDRAERRAPIYGDEGDAFVSPLHYGCGAGSGWGIPPGSALADFAAQISLKHILDAVESCADGVIMSSYGDNLMILTQSAKAADASIEALRQAAQTRVSPIAVEGLCTRIVRSTPKNGFKFVGSEFQLRQGKLIRRRAKGFEEAFAIKLGVDLMNKEIDRAGAVRRIDGWLAANSFERSAAGIAARLLVEFDLSG